MQCTRSTVQLQEDGESCGPYVAWPSSMAIEYLAIEHMAIEHLAIEHLAIEYLAIAW